jgi:hypothetical protein
MTLLRKSKTSLPAVAAVLLILLGVVGFCYAHWSTILTITGTVETGTLCARLTTPIDHKDKGIDWTCGEGFVNPDPMEREDGKDYGSCELLQVDDTTLQVTMSNVYPCYYENIEFHITNCGTVPWKIYRVNFKSASGEFSIYNVGYFTWDLNNDGTPDIEVSWGDNFGVQVDPNVKIEISFELHILQGAPQDAQMDFTIEMEIINWNETP